MRRNMMPYSRPGKSLSVLNAVANGGVSASSKTAVVNAARYQATVTAATAASSSVGGLVFGAWNLLPVIPGERYAITFKDVTVTARPATGMLRPILHWLNGLGVAFSSSFGENIPAGSYSDQQIMAIAPEGAVNMYYSFTWQPLTSDAAATGTLDFRFDNIILEPLGPVPALSPIAIVNEITYPRPKPDVVAANLHSVDGFPDGTGWVEHIGGARNGYSPYWGPASSALFPEPGTIKVRTHRNRSQDAIISGTIYTGFIGSYVLPKGLPGHYVNPGDIWTLTSYNNVTNAGPVGDPGLWMEMVWYYYDGDPAHTVTVRHDNSDHLLTPGAVALGSRVISMTKAAPENFVDVPGVGLRQANIMQPVIAIATSTPNTIIGFQNAWAMLTKTDGQIEYFDGDSLPLDLYIRPAWTGKPYESSSVSIGTPPRLPGPFADGDDPLWKWDGVPYASVSSERMSSILRTRILAGRGRDAAPIFNALRKPR